MRPFCRRTDESRRGARPHSYAAPMKHRRVRAVAGLALVGAATIGLVGCTTSPVDSAVTSALGTSAPVITTDGSVPSTYPTAAVPLVAGKVTQSVGTSINGKRAWEVTVDAKKAFSAAVSKLSAEGLAIDSTAATGGSGIAHLSSKAYSVTVTGGPATVLYVVTEK
jgi:hypothetical protein